MARKDFEFSIRQRTINLFDPEDGRNLAVENAVPVPKKAETAVNTDEFDKKKKKDKKKKS